MEVDVNSLIREQIKKMRMINLALAMGTAMYGLMMVYIHLYAPIPATLADQELIQKLEYSLIGYALLSLYIGKVVRKMLLNSPKIFIRNENSKQTLDQPPFIGNYLSSLFIVWTILETAAIGGIVLFLVSGRLEVGLMVVAISVFAKLNNGPRIEELSDLASQTAQYENSGI